MAIVKQVVGTKTAKTVTGLATLASATYIQTDTAYDCSVNQPMDVILELAIATTNVIAGNKQIVVFIRESLDGTSFRSGPTSGTVTTDEPNLRFVGTVPINTSSVTEIGTFSILAALGYIPKSFHTVIKNDCGVALTGGILSTSEISNTVA